MKGLRKTALLFVLALMLMAWVGTANGDVASAAGVPTWSGTYDLGTQTGTISWTPTRGIQPGWYSGYFVVDGVRHTGWIYALRDGSGRITMNWFYDKLGNKPAGSLIVTSQPDGSLVGPITLYNRDGTLIGTGTAVLR